jgi:hypothetical protein
VPAVSIQPCPAKPLIRQRASWRLPAGAADVPALRVAGLALLLATQALNVVFAWAVVSEAITCGGPYWPCFLLILAAGCLSWQGWRLAQSLIWPGSPLTLAWDGALPRLPALGATVTQYAGPQLRGGWHVVDWNQAVQVDLVWDMQGWLLLKVATLPGVLPHRTRWSWVAGTVCSASAGFASAPLRLRALLYLPKHQTAHVYHSAHSGCSLNETRVMADLQVAPWPARLFGALKSLRIQRQSALSNKGASSWFESSSFAVKDRAFAATEVMSERGGL